MLVCAVIGDQGEHMGFNVCVLRHNPHRRVVILDGGQDTKVFEIVRSE